MKPTCCMCLKNFKEYGAILFSPPLNKKDRTFIESFFDFGNNGDLGGFVNKYHICPKCYRKLIKFTQAEQEEAIK